MSLAFPIRERIDRERVQGRRRVGARGRPTEARQGAGSTVHVAKYRIEAGMKDHAMVCEEVFLLPTEGPGMPPRKRTHTVLLISDEPFEGGDPQVEATPSQQRLTQ